mgnify:FL=1
MENRKRSPVAESILDSRDESRVLGSFAKAQNQALSRLIQEDSLRQERKPQISSSLEKHCRPNVLGNAGVAIRKHE